MLGRTMVFASAIVVACSSGDAAVVWEGSIDTTATGVVVVSNPERGLWGEAPPWRLEPELRIGSVDDDGPAMFGQVVDAVTDAYGRVFVLDRTAKEIRVFDRTGAYVRTFGRAGAGPGELGNPNGLKLAPDGRLWVSDPQNVRYAVFDTSGSFMAHHRRPITSWGWLWTGGFTADGSMYESGIRRLADNEYRNVLIRLATDSTVALADTLDLPQSEPQTFTFEFTGPDGRAGTMGMQVPFTSAIVTLFDPRGYVWAAETGSYRIAQLDLATGDTLRIIEKRFVPVEVRQAEVDAIFARLGDEMKGLKYDASRIPATKPGIRDLRVDDAGYLWVAPHTSFEADSSAFDVFDAEGVYLGRLIAPLRMAQYATLEISSNEMLGFTRDELDVPYVVRLRIAGRPASAGERLQ